MPNLQASKKSMRQAIKSQARNYKTRVDLKKIIKDVLKLAKEGKIAEAEKLLPQAFSVIDTAAKKNIIHKNNAARKKSRLSKVASPKKA